MDLAGDIKTKTDIMKKYGLRETAMHDLVAECELSKHYSAIMRISGRTYWVHENEWVAFLEDKASQYRQRKIGRVKRGA